MLRNSSFILSAVVAACLACGGQQANDEKAVMAAISGYLEALDSGDFSTAHSLLASSIQARLPYDSYVRAHESSTPPEVKNAPPTKITYGEPSVSPYRATVPVAMSITDPAVVAMVQQLQQQNNTQGLDGAVGSESIDIENEYELIKEDSGWRVVLNEGAIALEEQAISSHGN